MTALDDRARQSAQERIANLVSYVHQTTRIAIKPDDPLLAVYAMLESALVDLDVRHADLLRDFRAALDDARREWSDTAVRDATSIVSKATVSALEAAESTATAHFDAITKKVADEAGAAAARVINAKLGEISKQVKAGRVIALLNVIAGLSVLGAAGLALVILKFVH